MSDPKILLFDIETAPLLSHTWGRYEQNVIEVEREWFILSVAWKWLGQKKISVRTLADYPGYAKDRTNDKALCKQLWELLNEADVVVGHNSDRFDLKKAFARFAIHGFPPPDHFQKADTLKMAKANFAFSSNRLDDLGKQLGVGRKLPTTGKHLWLGAVSGDAASLKKMAAYNKQDVALLERVYLKLREWGKHPNLAVMTGQDARACPVCLSTHVNKYGFKRSRTGWRQKFQCQGCAHIFVAGGFTKEAA
jgi:hypothetical protein